MKPYTIYLRDNQIERLREIKDDIQVSSSEMIRTAIDEYLDRLDNTWKPIDSEQLTNVLKDASVIEYRVIK